MRTIKFRAWNKKLKQFVYFDISKKDSLLVNSGWKDGSIGDWQEYTSLKDKNGTGQEIYEGDIIDEEGLIIGNVYEEPSLNNKPYLLIEDFGGENWCNTYKEAMDRGCQHA